MSIFSEFKKFAVKGNVVDMAVGIIIGAAFGKIVTSLVNDVITPPIGLLIDGVDFSKLNITLKEAEGEATAVVLNYGLFLQTVLNFLIIAFAIFLFVKGINRLREHFEKDQAEQAAKPAIPSAELKVLQEIRDTLKKN